MTVQRVGADGTPLWGPNGVPAGASTDYSEAADIVGDGSGGALVVWVDHSSDSSTLTAGDAIVAQRLDADGNSLWDAARSQVCAVSGAQDNPRVIRAGPGAGAGLFVWRDCRGYLDRDSCFANADIYAQQTAVDGSAVWPKNGTTVTSAVRKVLHKALRSDRVSFV